MIHDAGLSDYVTFSIEIDAHKLKGDKDSILKTLNRAIEFMKVVQPELANDFLRYKSKLLGGESQ
jgi:hypothetical protein